MAVLSAVVVVCAAARPRRHRPRRLRRRPPRRHRPPLDADRSSPTPSEARRRPAEPIGDGVALDGRRRPARLAGGHRHGRRRQRPDLRRGAGRHDPDRHRTASGCRRRSSTSPDRITSGGERGLLGLAFHPDFPTDPRFFVDYTDAAGRHRHRVVPRGSGDAGPGRPRRPSSSCSTIPQPFANHNGGSLAFGERRDAATSAWATAGPAATRRATASGWTRCSARSCASTSSGRTRRPRSRTRIPSDNPYADDRRRDCPRSG